MSDILPALPKPPAQPPQKPSATTNDVDAFAYGFGGVLLIGSQFISKTAPKFAEKVFENIAGPAVALGGPKKVSYPFPKPAFLLAPAPFGFVDPTKYGLPPNYLYGIEARLKSYGMGLEHLTPPHSEFLRNLPDNDPRVRYAEFEHDAEEQLRAIEKQTPTATLGELLELLAVAKSPDASKVFFKPEDVINSLEVSLRIRVGQEQANKLLTEALVPPAAIANLPNPLTPPDEIPSPLAPQQLLPGVKVVDFQTTADLFAHLRNAKPPVPKDAKPVNALQQVAAKLAPLVLRDLETERADP